MLKQILISIIALAGLVSANFSFDDIKFNEYNFTQLVDHTQGSSDKRTFNQRYFVSTDYFDKDTGPVFLYICGEGTCKPPSDRGYPVMVAKVMNAMFVVLEHRFYGSSQPFEDWQTENLHYLNATLALADLANFIDFVQSSIKTQYGGSDRKVVTIGGSYPGALSAWFKAAYQDKAVAAWSSSGVIQPIRNFDLFDTDIYTATSRSGPLCPQVIQEITTYIDTAFRNHEKGKDDDYSYILRVFGIDQVKNAGDFMFFIADIFTIGVQYGGRKELCQILMSLEFTDVKNRVPVIAQYAKNQKLDFSQYDRVALQNVTYDIDKNMRQWTWQYCTEFGWFQVPADKNPMRSAYINADYWVPYCEEVFGIKIGDPNIKYYTDTYGGLDINAKNIYFVNSIEDPWQWAGMRTIHNKDTQKDLVATLIDCNDCGHCQDLKTPSDADPPALRLAREDILLKLKGWINPTTPKERLFLE